MPFLWHRCTPLITYWLHIQVYFSANTRGKLLIIRLSAADGLSYPPYIKTSRFVEAALLPPLRTARRNCLPWENFISQIFWAIYCYSKSSLFYLKRSLRSSGDFWQINSKDSIRTMRQPAAWQALEQPFYFIFLQIPANNYYFFK